jgi:hypothetical protein
MSFIMKIYEWLIKLHLCDPNYITIICLLIEKNQFFI